MCGSCAALRSLINEGGKPRVVTSPLPSRGPTRGQNCYVTPAVSGVSNEGDKIKSGYLTNAFSGAHNWEELLHNPCMLVVPQARGQNQK